MVDLAYTIHTVQLTDDRSFRGSADLFERFNSILVNDEASVRRVLYLTKKLVGIAYEEASAQLSHSSAIDIHHILAQCVNWGAAGFVIIDHYLKVEEIDTTMVNSQTCMYRELSPSFEIELVDHIVVSPNGWFTQTFRRKIDLLVRKH